MTISHAYPAESLAPRMNADEVLERTGASCSLSRREASVMEAGGRLSRVGDVMSTDVICAAPHSSIREVAVKLVDHGISSVPVVDKTGRLVGIVSESDLIRRVEIGTEPRHSWWRSLLTDTTTSARAYVRSHGRQARDVMSISPVTASPDEPLYEVAARMARKRLKCLPVLRDGLIVGVIARRDLVRKLAEHSVSTSGASNDAAYKALAEGMRALPWGLQARVFNTDVQEGIASLYGWAASPIERRAVEIVAENTPGVVQVRNNILFKLAYI